MTWVSSGVDGEVWALNNGRIFRRLGVTRGNPTGISWKPMPGYLVQIDVFGGQIWGIDLQGNIVFGKYRC